MAANDPTGIVFEGMAEFENSMYQLSVDLPEKVVRKGVRAGGEVMQAAISLAAPVRPDLPSGTALPPGALQSDIELHVVKEDDGSFSAIVEPGKYSRYAAVLTEYGHEMIAGGRKGKGGKAVGRVPPHPFFRPTWEANEDGAMMVAEEKILAEIEREAQKLGFSSESSVAGLLGTGA